MPVARGRPQTLVVCGPLRGEHPVTAEVIRSPVRPTGEPPVVVRIPLDGRARVVVDLFQIGVKLNHRIGASWAAHFLARGHDVVVWDPATDAEARVRAAVDAAWPALTSLGLAGGASPSRLGFEADPADAVRGATFVQESAPERLPLKHELYAQIESTLAPDVIIASSTSGLLASDLQAGMRHPERFVVGHPYNPPHLIPLVEVVGGGQTSEETIERAMEFYRAEGKRPIRVRRELRGHIANRLQAAVWRESIHLVLTGRRDRRRARRGDEPRAGATLGAPRSVP
jgi:hypothetical protein